MLRIKLNSPLIALVAACGIATASFGHSAYAADLMERPGGGGGAHGGGHPGGGGFGGGGHGGGGHSPAPGGGHSPGAGGGFGGGGHGGGGHNPGPGGIPGYHPPAPTPGHGGHGPTPGGNPGYHPPAPTPGHGGHGPTPGGNPGYHPPAPYPGNGGHGHAPGGNPGYHPPAPIPGGHTGGGFPGNHGNPGDHHGGMPVGHSHGPGYGYGHDNHGNIVSPIYHDHIDLGRRRMDDMRRDTRVSTWVNQRGAEYRDHYHPILIRDNDRFVRYHDDYRERFRPWWNEGFYGGCYWGYHPFYDIDTYFYDPMVYWFYNTDGDDYYYRTWYGPEYDRYPQFKTHYRYVRAFYPTEEFRDMNLGISALSIDAQAKYLQTSTTLGDRLAAELNARGGNSLDENSVVVDHYQILPDDKGVVVEGFVDQDDVQFAFKAVQDFANPDNTTVFAVTADDDVNSDRVDQLRQLNTQIEDMGGVAEGVEGNDGTVTAPSDDDQNTGATDPDNGSQSDWGDQNSPR